MYLKVLLNVFERVLTCYGNIRVQKAGVHMDKCKKILAILPIVGLIFLSSCGSSVSAAELAERFSESYGYMKALTLSYDPMTVGGDEDADDFSLLYGTDGLLSLCDSASVCLGTDVSKVAEYGFFVCRNTSDAMQVSEICLMRLDFLSGSGEVADTSYCNDARVLRRGRLVFYCALPDNGRAEKLFGKLT